jgi:peroxiredoxin
VQASARKEKMIEEGTPAPDISAKDQDGNDVRLSDFRGSRVVLYFYPKDDTPGCTKEACSFRDANAEYAEKGIKVIGVSTDSEKSHQKFITKHSLPFTLRKRSLMRSEFTAKRVFTAGNIWALTVQHSSSTKTASSSKC